MKLNLSGLYNGKIGLEKKVIDFSRFEIRQRITDKDVEKYYDEFIEKVAEIENYFQDVKAFNGTRQEIKNKRAKLIARESRYPRIFSMKHFKNLENAFNGKITDDKYFYAGHCLIQMPLTEDNPFNRLIDVEVRKDIKIPERYQEYKNYYAVIEVPNDRTQAETKGTTFHETLHYSIVNYQLKAGRLFTKDETNHSKEDRNVTEKFIQEKVVDYLTDLLLEDDKEALFEQRWSRYEFENPCVKRALSLFNAIATGSIIGYNITNPKLLPLAIIPVIIESVVYNKYKKFKKEELTKPLERKEFKI